MVSKMKAQISGTMVMYVMSGIVIMMVIGYGINQLLSLQGDLSKINCLNFRKELKERLIKDRPLGTIDSKGIEVSCDTPEICFIDLDGDSQSYCNQGSDLSPLICDSWDDGVRKNVFLMDEDMVFPMGSFYVRGLKPIGDNDEPYLCVNVNSGFMDVLMQGRGRYVVVKNPQ